MKYVQTQVEVSREWLSQDQRVEAREPSGDLIATGTCSRCKHDTSYPVVTEDVVVAEATGPVVAMRVPRMFRCRCDAPHERRPADVYTGCGAYWFATVSSEAGSAYSLTLAKGGAVHDAVAVDRAVASQATVVQATAEKWLGAISALLALFSVGGTVLAAGAASSLASPWRLMLAILAVLTVAAGASAIFFGHRAAFGWLTVVPTSSEEATSELVLRASDLKGRVAAFRSGVRAAAAALGLATAALLLIWLAPVRESRGPVVRMTYVQDGVEESVCGTLLAAPRGVRVLVVDGPRTSTVAISQSITNVTSVRSCSTG